MHTQVTDREVSLLNSTDSAVANAEASSLLLPNLRSFMRSGVAPIEITPDDTSFTAAIPNQVGGSHSDTSTHTNHTNTHAPCLRALAHTCCMCVLCLLVCVRCTTAPARLAWRL